MSNKWKVRSEDKWLQKSNYGLYSFVNHYHQIQQRHFIGYPANKLVISLGIV